MRLTASISPSARPKNRPDRLPERSTRRVGVDVGSARGYARKLRVRQGGEHGDGQQFGRRDHNLTFDSRGQRLVAKRVRRRPAKRRFVTSGELDTPALLLDLDAVERNLDRMAADVARTVRNCVRMPRRTKPRGSPTCNWPAAQSACVAPETGRSEVLADGGIGDILITSELVGEPKSNERSRSQNGRA